MIRRVFVEKRPGFDIEAGQMLQDLRESLGLSALAGLRLLNRYDAEGMNEADYRAALTRVFAEPQSDYILEETFELSADEQAFAIEYLPGQFDQRADSAAQAVQIITQSQRPRIACARVIVMKGALGEEDIARVKKYLINTVDSREATMDKPDTLIVPVAEPQPVASINGFISMNADALDALRKSMGLAMSADDIIFCQNYFRYEEGRDPTLTEIKVLDTYWSDHCRHTTFMTNLEELGIDKGELSAPILAAWEQYRSVRKGLGRDERPVTLMDIATIGAKELKKRGLLEDIEESEEINAASIVVTVDVDGQDEEWLVMFKNETHNHPTEIEPFGGAATCLGGAIRDPLSGRSYVYQAMRVTGAADPRKPLSETLPGKLPQVKITRDAARGYSSYGNQIGLATGMVHEVYHPRYEAKRMEIGAVVGAAPRENVYRGEPQAGDVVLLVGGRTGRDGIGGATGSSKEHNEHALANSAEVQKGDAPAERKLQRLFRRSEAAKMIVRCNDFGAGGVSVAIGELAPGLHIYVDRVPRKYEGLDGTELAISESQERMAIVLRKGDVDAFMAFVAEENLEGTLVADVTDTNRLVMEWRGQRIVDVSRAFLDTAGAPQSATVRIAAPTKEDCPLCAAKVSEPLSERLENVLSELNRCSQRGMIERFDSTIGAGSVLHPFGGANLATPPEAMVAKIPLLKGETKTGTMMSYGFDPFVSAWSPFHGATYAVLESLARIAASGGEVAKCRLTFQEYFPKVAGDPYRWGLPMAALLGALDAQLKFGTAAIGGKDSMSGSFKDMDVPPTLVSFAVCTLKLDNVITPEFKKAGSAVALLRVPTCADLTPDLDAAAAIYAQLHKAVIEGKVLSAHSVKSGGIAEAVAKMGFGNGIGFESSITKDELFAPLMGSIVVELAYADALPEAERIGTSIAEPVIKAAGECASLADLRKAWEEPLEHVFPTLAKAAKYALPNIPAPMNSPRPRKGSPVAKPRVFIPVFPGTNCEYDSARAFEQAGASVDICVLRNMSAREVEDSLSDMAKRIGNSQILMMPGGFSAGDEPDGSGKFAAAVMRNSAISKAIMDLVSKRDGLVLGICNGFQVLIKLGLIQYGEIRDLAPGDATLTFNTIGRHQSRYIRTKVTSGISPWLSKTPMGSVHTIPISHGEGRVACSEASLKSMVANGQVAFQYVDANGSPSMDIEWNPNGSLCAIEGLCSPCGRVLGKMGHSERRGPYVGLNVAGDKVQPIFDAGVEYFM
ncbi:MAG: phosphoribosylformylglycinamidine synthase [Opitutales bacterium]|nr:phosphoribosylformylglycinamidine synthase [Opitutales bacterium]